MFKVGLFVAWLSCMTAVDSTKAIDDLLAAMQKGTAEQAQSIWKEHAGSFSEPALQALEKILPTRRFQKEWIPFLKQVHETYPRSAIITLSLADTYLNAKSTDDAMTVLRRAVKNDSRNQDLLQRASIMAYTQHQYGEADTWINMLLEIDPHNVEGLFMKGCILSRQGQTDDARIKLKKVIELNPHHRLAHYELGLLENRAGNSQAAEKLLRLVVDRQPFFLEAYNALAVALARQGKTEDIKSVRNRAQYLKSWDRAKLQRIWNAFHNPDALSPQQIYELSVAFCQVGRDELAKRILTKHFDQIKKYDPMVLLLAQIHQNHREYQRCLDLLDQIQSDKQRKSEMYATLKGWSLLQLGKVDECREYYQEIAPLHADSKHIQRLKKALDEKMDALKNSSSPDGTTEKKTTELNPPPSDTTSVNTPTQTIAEGVFHFVDVTHQVGLDSFHHRLGHADKRWILDAMGSGVCVGDYDRDGDDDIYFVNGRPDALKPEANYHNVLFQNEGGRFIDVTSRAGVGDTGYGMCALFGDVDNDGWLDLFVGNYGANVLYHNNGDGTFTDVTSSAGVGDKGYAAAAAFGDVDRDGDLDLFVGNYVEFDPEKHGSVRGMFHEKTVFAGPLAFEGQPDILYVNDGHGVFTDLSEDWGMNPVCARAMGAVFFDLENDGDLDLYVTNDSTYNFVLENQDNHHYKDISFISGGAFTETGVEGASMGVIAGDYNNDLFFDLFITSYECQTDRLFFNDGKRRLIDSTGSAGLLSSSYNLVTWGCLWNDFDADGWLDLFTANGHIYPQVRELSLGSAYEQGVSFYRNVSGKFNDVTNTTVLENYTKQAGRGAALIDYDLDGDLDLVINNMDSPPQLLQNLTPKQHWLTLRFQGSSAELFGTRVVAKKGETSWSRIIDGGSGYLSQSSTTLFWGFGDTTAIDEIRIYWPHAETQVIPFPALNKVMTIRTRIK